MKSDIYVRISDDRAGERAGVQRQREDCAKRAQERGWEVHAVHEDNDISATTGKRRPGFEAMLADIESGRVRVVIAWALDRLQRNRRDELRLYETCRKHGVTISLVNGTELDFSTAAGRFVADSLGSVARLEVEMKSDRQRRAQEQAAKAGKRSGGRKPFGYTADGLEPLEPEASAVKAAYRDYLSGVPLARVAQQWNDAELFSGQERWGRRKGEPSTWAGRTVADVLKNPRYAGLRAYNGEIVAQAVWPALVTEDVWRATVAKMASRGTTTSRKPHSRLLSGLARCGVCGAPVWSGGSARGKPGYRCSESMGHFARMAEPCDEYVSAVIVERLSRPDAAALLRAPTTVDTAALHEEGQALRERLDGVAVEFADGSITAAQLRTITERLRERIADLERKMADAGRVDLLGPLVTSDDVRATWDRLPLGHRRAIVDTLATVTLHPPGRGTRTFRPETIGIEWK